MALNQNTLKDEFLKLMDFENPNFVGWPATVAQAAINYGNVYNTYASTAQDLSTDNLVTANLPGFISALTSTLPPDPLADINTLASAYDLAFVSYWTAAVFAIGIPPTPTGPCPNIGGNFIFSTEISSVVTAVVPGVLKGLLLPEFAVGSLSAETKAINLANIFHTATTTAVFVLTAGLDTTPTPAGPLPITNTCTIF